MEQQGENMITFYTKHCDKCKILEEKLKKLGICYKTCEDMSILLEKGFTSVPYLEWDGNFYNYIKALTFLEGWAAADKEIIFAPLGNFRPPKSSEEY